MAGLDADDLIGRTYLTEPYSDGNRTRMWIVELLDHDDQERMVNTSLAHFKAVNIDRTFEEIIEYNTILDRVEKVDGEVYEWPFALLMHIKDPSRPLTLHTEDRSGR